MRLVSIVSCGSALLFLPKVALAQTDLERAAARDAAAAGSAAFEAGRYQEAFDSLSHAEALVHAPTHLLFMARAEAKLGKLVAAHELYMKIVREEPAPNAPKVFADARAAAEDENAALEKRIPAITVRLEGVAISDARVILDDAALSKAMVGIRMPVDPGSHVLQAKSASSAAAPVTVVVLEGAAQGVRLVLEPTESMAPVASASPARAAATAPVQEDARPSSGSPLRFVSYAVFGVGAIGLGLGTFSLVKSGSTRASANQLFDACSASSRGGKCSDPAAEQAIVAKDRDADGQRNLGVGALIAGGAAVGVGVALLLLGNKSSSGPASQAGLHVTPVIGWGSVGASGIY